MTDSKKDPTSLPPDDFSQTTPNIRIPNRDLPSSSGEGPASDWEKTNYNYGQQIKAEDWGSVPQSTPVNPTPPPSEPVDFNKTYIPGKQSPLQSSQHASGEQEWDKTQLNIKLPQEYSQPREHSSAEREDFGASRQDEYGMTTPNIQLPESEKRKYQQSAPPQQERQRVAPPPVAAVAAEAAPTQKKGGIPGWVYAVAGMLMMFFFASAVLLGVYFLFLNKTGFNVVVKGAKPESDIYVDGVRWQVSSGDGSIKVQNLKAGLRKITIKKAGFADDAKDVDGKDGETKEIIAQQKQTSLPQDSDCVNIKKGDFAKAERCAYEALAKLGNPFTVDELLRAMNLYIINFSSGSANIPPSNLKFLEKASGYMKQLPQNVLVEVGGHTDNVGNDASNLKLSENRARAVKDALIKFGVLSEMLEVKGYGETKPRSSNDTDDGRFQNRRIEYTAVSK